MKRAAGALLVAATVAACYATVPAGDGPGRAGGEWRQAVELRLGERAVFDGGALEVTLRDVGVNEAELWVDASGVVRQVRVRAGAGGAFTAHPYRVTLLSTSIANTARVEVTKLR